MITINGISYIKKLSIDGTDQSIIISEEEIDQWFNLIGQVSSTFDYDSTTNYTWISVIDSSGLANNATFIVDDISLINNTGNICTINNFTSGGSFYLFCYLGNQTTNKVYHVYSSVNFTNGFTDIIYNDFLNLRPTTTYTSTGLIAGWLIIMALTLVGFTISDVAGLLGFFMGVVLSVSVDFIQIDPATVVVVGLLTFIVYSLRRGD